MKKQPTRAEKIGKREGTQVLKQLNQWFGYLRGAADLKDHFNML
jgi:hypothetical protein